MKVIIVEDEKPARDNLEKLLIVLEPSIEIQAKLDSVSNTVAWLSAHQTDLIFLDIHLADDLSFKIFEQINVTTPVIFTTAYDQYALRAFRVNSVDYLLKPIDKGDLQRSLEKFKSNQKTTQTLDIQQLIHSLKLPFKSYQSRFMVSRGEKVMSVTTDQIAYFEGEDRYVYLIKKDGTRYIVDYKLSDLEDLLDPKQFYRLNRSFITHFSSIKNIFNVSKSRVKVELEPSAKREIMVSSENTQEFKSWLNQ
ncbi:MAG: LytTR family DNA-binding domain-containing protein [Bacteroidetes bacterium]|nr:LytTR family DNA-binding domain-containing protein [Bacteroidota bacterium]